MEEREGLRGGGWSQVRCTPGGKEDVGHVMGMLGWEDGLGRFSILGWFLLFFFINGLK